MGCVLMEADEREHDGGDGEGDDHALALPRVLEDVLRRGELPRFLDLPLQHLVGVELLARARVCAAVGTQPGGRVDLPMACRAGEARTTHFHGMLCRRRSGKPPARHFPWPDGTATPAPRR